MGKTSIEWTDRTWSPLRARVRPDAAEIAKQKGYASLVPIAEEMAGHVGPHCEAVSHGCDNCYSGTNNHRCLPSNGTGLPFDRRSRDLIEPFLDEKILMQPLRWKQPQRIFVENQSDLFGEWNTDEMIDRVFAVMALCPQDTFQVLTKQPKRMLKYLTSDENQMSAQMAEDALFEKLTGAATFGHEWPLPNVWLGVSVEDQKTADERSDLLRQVPAALRFISQEPQLEYINWRPGMLEGISWLIQGGESGPGARLFDLDWARETRDDCAAAKTAYFFKQAGGCVYDSSLTNSGRSETVRFKDRKGGDPLEWPTDLQNCRQFPEVIHA